MYLAYNMFVILDEERRPDIIRDEGRRISYEVLDVVKPKEKGFSHSIIGSSSSSNEDSLEEEQ